MFGFGKWNNNVRFPFREKFKTKEKKIDRKILGPATFKVGTANRACYVENTLLAENIELNNALQKSKNLLSKTASEVTCDTYQREFF